MVVCIYRVVGIEYKICAHLLIAFENTDFFVVWG